jgi:hypothetical protein
MVVHAPGYPRTRAGDRADRPRRTQHCGSTGPTTRSLSTSCGGGLPRAAAGRLGERAAEFRRVAGHRLCLGRLRAGEAHPGAAPGGARKRPAGGRSPGSLVVDHPSPFFVIARLERARIAEQLGDRDTAIRWYRFVVAAWRHADPELQPRVAEARTAAAVGGGRCAEPVSREGTTG